MDGRIEYRAVFRYPECWGFGQKKRRPADTYGPPVRTLEEAQRQTAPRVEETHGWNAGIQTRTVTDWR